MTLLRCFRATCDAPGCTASQFVPHGRTAACRQQLAALDWIVVPWRVRCDAPGASRIAYLCPQHGDQRPEGWREVRLSAIRHRPKRPRTVSLAGVVPPTAHLDAARRAAAAWMLAEVTGSQMAVARAFGVSHQRVHQLVADYRAILVRRQESEAGWQEPWAKRLRAAGAIR